MKRLVLIASSIIALSSLLISCKSNSTSPQVEQQRSELYEALKVKNLERMEVLADSMANEVGEDLSVDESVAVLIAYLNVHNDAAQKKDSEKDLETLRKFVDFYELASRNKGEDLNKAFNSAKEIGPNLDLAALVKDFGSQLAEFDSGTANDDASAAKTAEPKSKEKKEEAKKDDAKKDAKKDDAKKDASKKDAPKKDAPKKEAPKADQPVMPVD